MCAIVPVTPVVVTLPVTVLSSPIEIVPLPAPDEVTGGTSWPPLNMTLTSSAWAENGYQVTSTAAPRATTTRERLAVREIAFILFSTGPSSCSAKKSGSAQTGPIHRASAVPHPKLTSSQACVSSPAGRHVKTSSKNYRLGGSARPRSPAVASPVVWAPVVGTIVEVPVHGSGDEDGSNRHDHAWSSHHGTR